MTRSLEITVQWDGITRIWPVSPLSLQEFEMAGSGRLGFWLQVVEGLHRRLSELIHGVGLLCIAGRKLSRSSGIG